MAENKHCFYKPRMPKIISKPPDAGWWRGLEQIRPQKEAALPTPWS